MTTARQQYADALIACMKNTDEPLGIIPLIEVTIAVLVETAQTTAASPQLVAVPYAFERMIEIMHERVDHSAAIACEVNAAKP